MMLVLGVVATVWAHPAFCADAPAARTYFRGGAIIGSLGEGWKLEEKDGPEIAMFRAVDKHHQLSVSVFTYLISATLNAEDLERLVRARRWAVWSGPDSPMTPKSFELARDSTMAPLAVRFHYQLEDRRLAGKKGKPYIYETRGVALVHPDSPHLLVSLEFNEWAEASVPRTEVAGLDSLLSRVELTRVESAAARRVDVGPRPVFVRPAHGALWTVCSRASQDEWTRTIAAPGSETGSATSTEILRLDPSTLEILTRVRHEGWISDLAETPDAIWASDYENGALLRLDPATGATTATVKCGGKPVFLLVTSSALWVTDQHNGTVQSMDLRSHEMVGKPIKDLKQPYSMVESGGLVWVVDRQSRTVASFDPGTHTMTGTPIPVAQGAGYMVAGDGSLWVACGTTEAIQRLDPVKRMMSATIPLGCPPSDLAFTGGVLWVGSWNDGRMMKVDPGTNHLMKEAVRAGLGITAVVASDHGVCVTDRVGSTIILVPAP